ncbi:hypothetical protein [Brevundimonas denitrificans]|uniref:hypothetical protein n=1 Tax=Brevundimonas denitrificans TaxID=1443434 RepID=UPI00223BD0A3|nr:hypothetical protein [Brevundimonas denitrificans]
MKRPLPLIVVALTVLGAATAVQAEPRALVRGEVDGDLFEALERAVGETDARIETVSRPAAGPPPPPRTPKPCFAPKATISR